MALNKAVAAEIIHNIRLNHAFNAASAVPFHTDDSIGFIPAGHLETYRNAGDFSYDRAHGILRFSSHVRGFERKTAAMANIAEGLIANGLIARSTEPHFQEVAVGNDLRTLSPMHAEFKVNRAYRRFFGFPMTGVFLNITLDAPGTDEKKILLQRRSSHVESANSFDFAVGGGVKFPQTHFRAVQTQGIEEMGAIVSKAAFIGNTSFCFSSPEKDWVTNDLHLLFSLTVDDLSIGTYEEEEVQGFHLASPEEAVEYAANGQFARQNIQSFMTSMVLGNLLPEFDGADSIRMEISRHLNRNRNTVCGNPLARRLSL